MIKEAPVNKKRIEFIDLAKGVCILLVVSGHSGGGINMPGFQMMRMPLYFILSGLFFKDYGGFLELAVKKINKILIPFLFFYLIAYIPYYLFEGLKPGLIRTDAQGILDVFNNRQFFNGPIWFLLALFWANLIFCAISLNVKKEYLRAAIVVLIGFIGILLGNNDIFLPCFLDVAMTALPFFYFGYILKKTPLLFPNRYDRYNLVLVVLLYLITYAITVMFDGPHFSFHYNKLYGNVLLTYIGSISCVIAILLLCKMLRHVPIISYCGRYSIVLLCLHHMIYRPIKLVVDKLDINYAGHIISILTIASCIAMIPLCIKYIPWFTAQKDLVKSPSEWTKCRKLCHD